MKSVQMRIFSGPNFLTFVLNKEIYSVDLRIQSKSGEMRTRKNSIFTHFSRNDQYTCYETMKVTSSSLEGKNN